MGQADSPSPQMATAALKGSARQSVRTVPVFERICLAWKSPVAGSTAPTKPPTVKSAVEASVMARLGASRKPAVVYFLGASAATGPNLPANVTVAADVEHAARCAVALASGQ